MTISVNNTTRFLWVDLDQDQWEYLYWTIMYQRNWSWINSALGKDFATLSSSGQRLWHDTIQVILDNWSLTRSPPRNAPRICVEKILDPCGEKHVCSSQPTCFPDIRCKILSAILYMLPAISHSCKRIKVSGSQFITFNAKSTPMYVQLRKM